MTRHASLLRTVGALGALSTSACARDDGDATHAVTLRFEDEAARLIELIDVGTVASLAIVVVVLLVLGRALDEVARRFTRDGAPLARIVDEGRPLLKAIVVAVVVLAVLRAFLREVPLLGGLSLAVLAAGAFFRLGVGLPGWLAGFTLVVRGEIRERDRVLIDGREGVVLRIDWARVRVRFDDGTEAAVPLARIGTGGASIASPKSAIPLEVVLHLARALPPVDVEALERVWRLCPYRDTQHPLRARVDAHDAKKLVVALHVWSEAAAPKARAFILRAGHARAGESAG